MGGHDTGWKPATATSRCISVPTVRRSIWGTVPIASPPKAAAIPSTAAPESIRSRWARVTTRSISERVKSDVTEGNGNDTYYYQGGNALISENGGGERDYPALGHYILGRLFWRIASAGGAFDDLLIQINGGGSLQVHYQFWPYSTAYQVQSLVFADSSTVDLSDAHQHDVESHGRRNGPRLFCGSGNVTVLLSGGDNNVTLYDGNDTVKFISGNNHVTGGSGNDTYIAESRLQRDFRRARRHERDRHSLPATRWTTLPCRGCRECTGRQAIS